jgi:energy-coupling factor transporter ATP-binding protein EcfA2
MIKTLVSNIKTQNMEFRHRFQSPYVLLTGRNGSGKSGLIHALELAVFGQVYDAAGKDIKSKGLVAMLTSNDEPVVAQAMTTDNMRYDFHEASGPKLLNAMDLSMKAMTGGTNALSKFLLQYLDDDMPLSIVYQGWDAQVERHGGYREALLRMQEVVGKALRSHRAKIKELDIATKYASNKQELIEQRSEAVLNEAQAKDLDRQIKAEVMRFVREATPHLEKQMESYMPSSMAAPKFHFAGNEVRLGLASGAIPSGAESVALAAALAASVLNVENSIFVYPDRAYDAKTLGEMMRVARTFPAQGVFIQSTVEPEEYDAESMGWHLMDLT